VWTSSELSIKTKIDVLAGVTCLFSTAVYVAETWTMKAADTRKLLAFEMRCYRRTLKVRWKHTITNNSIRDKVQRNFTVENIIKHRKLRFLAMYVVCQTRTGKN